MVTMLVAKPTEVSTRTGDGDVGQDVPQEDAGASAARGAAQITT